MKKADLYLDTIGFSGFNTAMQATSCNLPIVTKEGFFMRGRLASSILRYLKLDELVSTTNEEYINNVITLIQNKDLIESHKERIANRKVDLFNDFQSIKVLEQFLINITSAVS